MNIGPEIKETLIKMFEYRLYNTRVLLYTLRGIRGGSNYASHKQQITPNYYLWIKGTLTLGDNSNLLRS